MAEYIWMDECGVINPRAFSRAWDSLREGIELTKLVDQFDKDFPDLVKYGRNLTRQ